MLKSIAAIGRRTCSLVIGCAAVGCGAAAGEGSDTVCQAPPGVETKAAAPGVSPQGFGQQGRWSNGVWANGVLRNAVWRNGILINGVEGDVSLQGSELRVASTDGTLLSGADIVGGELELVGGARLEIASYERDIGDSALAWYVLTYEGENICGGETRGMFLPGLWDDSGARVAADQVPEGTAPVTFSCTTGFMAKCVSWGYKTWASVEQADLHQACTRMAPADYCGDGVPHTENGTSIDIVDAVGIQQQASKPGEMSFEAAWGPDGAVCVNQTRYADTVIEQGPLQPSCWSELPRCSSLQEAFERGAKLANFSRQLPRSFCEAPLRY